MRPKMTIREEREKDKGKALPPEQHPIWKKDVVIPRAFRWTLHPSNHSDVSWWMKRLKTDYLNKMIEMEVYDDADGKVFDWIAEILNDGADQKLDLRHLDQSSRPIYVITFSDLTISEHATEYDYKYSDVLTHRLKVHFKKLNRTNLAIN